MPPHGNPCMSEEGIFLLYDHSCNLILTFRATSCMLYSYKFSYSIAHTLMNIKQKLFGQCKSGFTCWSYCKTLQVFSAFLYPADFYC